MSTPKRNPEQTKERILEAATQEFAEYGFGGARVDAIAERAQANKAMLYHYFGNKEELFVVVLERTYAQIRDHERQLDLEGRDPVSAIRELVRFTFCYFVDHPEFIRLLNNENLYGAEHVKASERIPEMHSPMVSLLREVLERGVGDGVFRTDVDPVQLYISIAGLSYFYLSNAYTLSAIFRCDLLADSALQVRLDHVTDVVLGYLRS